jgi:hypothetical protein
MVCDIGSARRAQPNELEARLRDDEGMFAGDALPINGRRNVEHHSAVGADEVQVVASADLVVAVPFTQAVCLNHSQLFEQAERPVHGGQPDARPRILRKAMDAKRVDVGIPTDDVDQKLAVRGHSLSDSHERDAHLCRRLRHGVFSPDTGIG